MKVSINKWIRLGRKLNIIPKNVTKENRDEVVDWMKLYFSFNKK